MAGTIRVVIVDDSPLMQRVLTALLTQDPTIEVVGCAGNGREAITLVERVRPDVITMDVRMPVMDGLATTEHLMAFCPTPILVLTAMARTDLDITFKMIGAGALDVVQKPHGEDANALARQASDLIRRVKLLARVRVVRHLRGLRRNDAPLPRTAVLPVNTSRAVEQQPLPAAAPLGPLPAFPVVVIGASTGGPRAVNQLLGALPADFPAAVVVVQHIAQGFSAGMADWLGLACRMPVTVAQEQMALAPGRVLVAPDRCDLLIQADGRIHLSHGSLLLQRPSIDVAMQAAAAVFGRRCIGVLLTGMGRDGAYGMLTIKRVGGPTIAQDAATSAIYGMPKAAAELGAAGEILPIGAIAARLIALGRSAGVAAGVQAQR